MSHSLPPNHSRVECTDGGDSACSVSNGDNHGTTATSAAVSTLWKNNGSAPTTTTMMPMLSTAHSEAAVDRFCQFLRFETVSSLGCANGAYRACADWLFQRCRAISCLDVVFYLPEAPFEAPVIIAIWPGQDRSLPVLLLNSHYDVVPVDTTAWTVPAFDGVVQDGKIFGRGSQDMKCVCMQYLEALECIHQHHPEWKPARDIVLSFVPDEEIGGSGMAAFLESSFYKEKLPGIALALDEGLASMTDTFSVFYGERLPWWIDVTAHGPTGHGSRFIDNTAVEQLIDLANKAMAFRTGQRALLGLDEHSNCTHAAAAKNKTLGDVTSLNITYLEAGVMVGGALAYNCVPPIARCAMDIRISPHKEPSQIGEMLDSWCRECSKPTGSQSISWSYSGHGNDGKAHAITSTDPTVNSWYDCFATALQRHGWKVDPQIFPAATDSRFLRALGIRALGFSPMRRTEILLHENDEYIPVETFLEGINVYVALLKDLGSGIES